MPEVLTEKLLNYGALGIFAAFLLLAFVKIGNAYIDFMKDRITFYEQGLLEKLSTHDRLSETSHKRQEDTLGRIERKVEVL